MSDNATNFLGSHKQDPDFIRNNLFNQSIEWRLNPPSAPHFGGLWQRIVQIDKRFLLINLRFAKLTHDDFATIVMEAIGSREERQPGRRFSDTQSSPLGTTFCECANTSLSRVSQSAVDIIDPRQAALATDLETTASSVGPHTEPETKVDVKKAAMEVGDVVWLLDDWTPKGIWPLRRVTRILTGPDKTPLGLSN